MGGRLLGGPTMVGTTSNWEDELVGWLKPFLDRLGHKARRRMCPLYVAGLIGPGDRKSIQPMAERLSPGDYDQLHHFVSAQAHQQLKEELGLDHFEGRSWHGLHRHALMTMIAYAFLQHRRLIKARREKKNQRPAASTDVTSHPARHRRSHHSIKPSAVSVLPNLDQHGKAA